MQQLSLPDREKAREAILKRLKMATSGRTVSEVVRPMGSFVHLAETSLTETFATNLQNVSGKVSFYENIPVLLESLNKLVAVNGWKKIACPDIKIASFLSSLSDIFISDHNDLNEAEAIITGCEALIAETGSILVSSAQTLSRKAFVVGPVHIVIASESQLFNTADEAIQAFLQQHRKNIPSLISIITGPSRTADIEKTLILGAHGPKELFVLITKQNL